MNKCNNCVQKRNSCFKCAFCVYTPTNAPPGNSKGNSPIKSNEIQEKLRASLIFLNGQIKMLSAQELRMLSMAIRKENYRRKKELRAKLHNQKGSNQLKKQED